MGYYLVKTDENGAEIFFAGQEGGEILWTPHVNKACKMEESDAHAWKTNLPRIETEVRSEAKVT